MVSALRADDPLRLGRYRLLGRIGSGGQGTVYLGESPDGGQVAVKTLGGDLTDDNGARRRFAGEVALVRQVSSFCVAEVLDADLDAALPYIVSEYVPGPSLREAVAANGPMTAGALSRLAVSTVTALAAIHDAGIVHRDVKPPNVLLGPDGPRVIDFGIAKADGTAITGTGQVIGTIAYMSPEQILGERVGPASDMFSWAVTMVFAASGRQAFDAETVPATMHRILYTEPDLPVLPAALAELVPACLAKVAARRPTAKDVLLRLIAGSSDGGTTDAIRTEALTRGGPQPIRRSTTLVGSAVGTGRTAAERPDRARRRWPVVAGLAIVTVAAVTAVAVFLWPSSSASSARPPQAPAEGTLIFSDSFNDRTGWDGYDFTPDATGDNRSLHGLELTDGVYTMQAEPGATETVALSPVPPKQPASAPGGELKVMLGATAEIRSGSSAPGALGLLCLWDEETPAGYQFLLGLDGTATIQRKYLGQNFTLATGTAATPSGKVAVQASCRNTSSGTELRFWVNGVQVATATDPTALPTDGYISQVGFRVRIPEGGSNTLRVSWDDFTLHRLPG